jgi:hypothetical protein
VLFVKSKKVSQKGKNVGKKLGAIVTLIIGIFLFIPAIISIIIASISSAIGNVKEKQVISSIENKVIVNVDKWKEGFEYDGKKLVPVNLFMNSSNYNSNGIFKNLTKIGALVKKNTNHHYPFYQIDSDSGYKIYYVGGVSFCRGEYYSRTFVDKNDYDEVLKYYETAQLKISVCLNSAPKESKLSNEIKSLNLNIVDKQEELMKLAHEILDDFSVSREVGTLQKDNDNYMTFRIHSVDKVFVIEFDVYTKDNKMEVLLNGDNKVKDEIVDKYKETLFELINDSQAELLKSL